MDAQILTALISGAFAVASPLVTLAVKKAYERRGYDNLSEDRRVALTGTWTGTAHQEMGPNGMPLDLTVNIELRATKKSVRGRATFRAMVNGKERSNSFSLDGGFIHERFLMIRYNNIDSAIVEFGSMTFELSSDSKTLRGRYLGYGSISERLVYGALPLTKSV